MPTFLLNYWPVVAGLCLLAALWAGAVGYAMLARQRSRERRRAPDRWPLQVRAIINSEERKLWLWLDLAFVDYAVMVKMPVTRFSMPDTKQQGLHWYKLLSSLYCTFTVVRADGRVMGCVDLPAASSQASMSQRMKASVLKQCSVPYVILRQGMMPTIPEMRFRFLGEASAMPQSAHQAAAIDAASATLRHSISRNRQTRRESTGTTAPGSLEPMYSAESQYPSVLTAGFMADYQDDSFIMPLDSRRAGLK